jgi:hypothetical protein
MNSLRSSLGNIIISFVFPSTVIKGVDWSFKNGFIGRVLGGGLGSLIKFCEKNKYPPKTDIIKIGDIGDRLYFIIEGSVAIFAENEANDQSNDLILAYLGKNEFIGAQFFDSKTISFDNSFLKYYRRGMLSIPFIKILPGFLFNLIYNRVRPTIFLASIYSKVVLFFQNVR